MSESFQNIKKTAYENTETSTESLIMEGPSLSELTDMIKFCSTLKFCFRAKYSVV